MQQQGGGVTHNVGVDLRNSDGEGNNDGMFSGRSRSASGYGLNFPSLVLAQNYGYGYGYGYGAWTFGSPSMPVPPLLPDTSRGRGLLSRPLPSLGVQGGGILKKSPQSVFGHGRSHAQGRASVHSTGGGRGGKNLTKAALDADLDKWRLKDKRCAGQSLDAELDEYWSKKDSLDSNEG